MLGKIKNALFIEKIPAIVCAIACLTSVFLGFVLGYIFFVPGELTLAYEDTAAVYKAGYPYVAAIHPELSDPPVQSKTPAYDQPIIDNQPSHLYIVTIIGGYIAIYHAEENGGGLKEVTSTSVGTLAPEELALLTTGIKIYSEEALARILQDYSS